MDRCPKDELTAKNLVFEEAQHYGPSVLLTNNFGSDSKTSLARYVAIIFYMLPTFNQIVYQNLRTSKLYHTASETTNEKSVLQISGLEV